jgi:hypothetical protein
MAEGGFEGEGILTRGGAVMTRKQAVGDPERDARKPYRKPQLREYGSLLELVLTKGGGTLPDVGNNTKMSAGT